MSDVESIQKGLDETPDRFKLSESGYLGLNIFNGISNDEMKKELNFPNSIKTYKNMSYHGTINSALTLYSNLVSKADWVVKPPKEATEEEKKQAEFIRQCMEDMDQPFEEFIKDVLSMNIFGFSVHEKVFRKRTLVSGSKFSDGKIGWKKLAIRSQESIEKFLFSSDGNDVIGVRQNISNLNDPYNRFAGRDPGRLIVNIPRSKFLLFRTGNHRGDPFGKSMLRDAYLAWRYLTVLEEIESNGVAKDMVGLPILKLPPQYLSKDATPEQVAIRKYYENAMSNLQMNQQSAMILPNAFDPETRQPLFSLELLSMDGKKGFDTTKVKEYYKNLILTSLFADILIMGQSSTGSFALGQIKNSLSGAMAENIIREIKTVLNNDLIKHTYQLNGWDASRACTIDFENLETADLESMSKAVQRYASTSVLEVDREVLNRIRESIGVDPLPEDLKPQEDLIPGFSSRSGDGMEVGTTGNGTAKTVSGADTSSNNLENKG